MNDSMARQIFFVNKIQGKIMKIAKYFYAFLLAIALVGMTGCASSAKQEGTGEYVDDSVITAKVKTELLREPSLKSSEINVETFKGKVQLSGFVSSQEDINKAAEIARNVKGVVSVKNNMQLK
jgi:osmotically-inducible protein OsmY